MSFASADLQPSPRTEQPLRRQRKPKVSIELPELPPHHHEKECSCEPVVAYIRVSSLGGRERIVSPQIQLDEIMLDSLRFGRRVVRVYFDLKSGKTMKGRKVEQILAEIKEGLYRTVSVWKWSRWGRNTLQSLEWASEVDKAGGQVVSATEAFDTKTPTGEMIRDMLLVQAAWQSRTIGEGWRNVQRLRRQSGLPHSGRERFGYVYENRSYTIEPSEAMLLEKAYEEYVEETTTFSRIAREWNALGYLTTMGNRWTPQGVGKMLDTGFAAGLIRERSAPKEVPANKITEYDVWRRGSQPVIIDEQLWLDYRSRREARASTPPRLRQPVHALSGMMFCGICGRRASTKYAGRNKTHQWICTHRAGYHPDTAVGVSNEIALDAVREWVRQRSVKGDARAAERASETTEKAQQKMSAVPPVKSSREQAAEALKRLTGKRDRLREMWLEGTDSGLTKEKFKAKLAEFDEEEREIRAVLLASQDRARLVDRSSSVEVFHSIDARWGDLTPSERNRLLSEVVGMVRVFPRSSVLTSSLRVDVVPLWEMSEWGDDWLAERRRWEAAA